MTHDPQSPIEAGALKHPDTPLLSTAYRGSMHLAAVDELEKRGITLRWVALHQECWRDGKLIHRCTDNETGAWIEVENGGHYKPHRVVAYSPSLSLSAQTRCFGGGK